MPKQNTRLRQETNIQKESLHPSPVQSHKPVGVWCAGENRQEKLGEHGSSLP
jgi:hypothetical protein